MRVRKSFLGLMVYGRRVIEGTRPVYLDGDIDESMHLTCMKLLSCRT